MDDLVQVTFSGLRLNRAAGTFDSLAVIANTSKTPISEPIQLVITEMNPPSVSLANASGTTTDGLPFVEVPLDDGELSPGEQVANIVVMFSNPSRVRFTFTVATRGEPVVSDRINLVPYDSISPKTVDFEDVAAAPPPLITIFDGILESGDVKFAERFAGQTLSIIPGGPGLAGPTDELSGVPSDPLTLQPGEPNKNLAVLRRGEPLNNTLHPCGDRTCVLFSGLGEGAFALVFPDPVSGFGFIAGGGDPGGDPDGDIVVQFFRDDGTLIAAISVLAEDDPALSSFGFQREDGIKDIAGVSIHTTDLAGLRYDDFRYAGKGIEILLDPPPEDDRYVIDETPLMPSITARARVVNVTRDPTPMATFFWAANLRINKGTGEEVNYDGAIQPNVTTVGEALFTLTFKDPTVFRGGRLKLTAEAEVEGEVLTGEKGGLTIEGTNPLRSDIQDAIDDDPQVADFQGLKRDDMRDVLKRMACQESRQRQFDAAGDGGVALPLISSDNGVGIYQITNTNRCPRNVLFQQCAGIIFNWRENVEEGIATYRDKVRETKGHPSRLREVQGYRDFIRDVVNPLREDAGLSPIGFAPAPEFTTTGVIGSDPPNQLLEDGVRGYNGFNGDLVLAGVVITGAGGGAVSLHEFRPDEVFLTTVPDSEIPGLNTDPRVWRRVPLNERPEDGAPNYVDLVTSRSPQCEP